MEYLPDKKNMQVIQKEKEHKLHSFREYLVDSGTVDALVKFLLSCRKQSPWPEDPLDHLHDYFDNYRDPAWDEFENMQEENKQMAEEKIPQLEETIQKLQNEVRITKRQNRAYKVYAANDTEGTEQIGTKLMIAKLSGNSKFDTDTKMNKKQFYHLLTHFCEGNEEDDENFNKFITYFEKTVAEEPSVPFTGDLENPDYVHIQEKMRSFQPPEENVEEQPEAAD